VVRRNGGTASPNSQSSAGDACWASRCRDGRGSRPGLRARSRSGLRESTIIRRLASDGKKEPCVPPSTGRCRFHFATVRRRDRAPDSVPAVFRVIRHVWPQLSATAAGPTESPVPADMAPASSRPRRQQTPTETLCGCTTSESDTGVGGSGVLRRARSPWRCDQKPTRNSAFPEYSCSSRILWSRFCENLIAIS